MGSAPRRIAVRFFGRKKPLLYVAQNAWRGLLMWTLINVGAVIYFGTYATHSPSLALTHFPRV